MTEMVTNRKWEEIWAGRVVLGWAVVVLAADLKVTVPYIHWAVSALAVVLILPYLLRARWKERFPARAPVWLFIVAVCIPVLYGARAVYSLAEAVKLAVILLGGISIFVVRSQLAHYAFRGFVVAVYLNLFLLIGGFLGLGSASIMATARWGTILDFPGSLSRVGITVWVFAAYLLVKRRSATSLGLLVASTVVVYADGSRTTILLLLVGALYLVLVLAAEAKRLRRAMFVGAMSLSAVVAAVAYSAILSGEGGASVGRVSEFSSSVQAQGLEGLETADAIRFRMLQDGVEAIQAHPIWGTGIETTTTETIVGPMGIHMTYLQVWADMGLLGLTAFVWLMWGWIVWVPMVLRRIRVLSAPAQRALYYNALFLLFFYGLAAFFHPLSTEWSEWIVFIIPYALIWEVTRSKGAAPQRPRVLEAHA